MSLSFLQLFDGCLPSTLDFKIFKAVTGFGYYEIQEAGVAP